MNIAADTFELATYRNPFTDRAFPSEMREGVTVADIVRDAGIDPRFLADVQVTISRGVNAYTVPMSDWGKVRPKAGSHVLVHPREHGAVAGLLLSALLPSAASYVAGTLFALKAGTLTYALTYAAVTIVGSLLVQSLIPPPARVESPTQDDPNFSITGSSNTENRYGVYPTVLGRHLMYPPKTARGYTEGEGGNIYFRGRFTFGYGPVVLETLRIGTTPITEFEGVKLEFLNVDETQTLANLPDLEPMVTAWRQGDEAMSLYPDDIAEDGYSVKLSQGVAVVRATRERAISVSVDVTYQGLVTFDGSNNKQNRSVEIAYRFRQVGEPEWTDAGTETHTGRSTAQLRFTKTIALPSEGEYDIEVTRLSADSDDAFLSVIRSVQSGSLPSHAGVAEVAVRIKASDQLNGQLDTLNGVVQQMAAIWDGSGWSDLRPVRHPAWIYARALMGPSLKSPVAASRMQLEDLRLWADEEPHWTCDAVIDQASTTAEILDLICATGRARRTLRDLKYSIIRDGGAGPVIQQFSPRNSSEFTGSITFPKEIHGFRVRCLSERLEWEQDEIIVYADGYDALTATEFETLELRGVVLSENDATGGNAWRLGRYHLAQAVLRPETFEWRCDIDHLRVNMGDKVRLVHDVPMIGVGYGRVRSVAARGDGSLEAFSLDEFLPLGANSYRVIVRRADGSEIAFQASPPVVNTALDGGLVVADAGAVVFDGGLPDAVATAVYDAGSPSTEIDFGVQDVDWLVPASAGVSATAIAVGDLVSVEETIAESMEVLVSSITHQSDLTAIIRGVPAAPAVLTADQGEIPSYVPNITTVTSREDAGPAAPIVLSAVVNAEVEPPRIVLDAEVYRDDRFNVVSHLAVLVDTESGEEVDRKQFTSSGVSMVLPEVGGYTLKLYAIDQKGRVSVPSVEVVEHVAEDALPGVVPDFQIRILGDQAQLTWEAATGAVSHYHIKHLPPGAPGAWNEAVDIERDIPGRTATVPALPGSYLVKAVSVFGEYSPEATVVSSTIVTLAGYNVVREVALHPDFEGGLAAGLYRSERGVQLLSAAPWADWPTWAEVGYWSDQGAVADFTVFTSSAITDLRAVMTSRVTATMDGYGFDLGDRWSDWGYWSDVGLWAGDVDGDWRIRLQVSTTEDDPDTAGADWTEWSDFLVGDYLARGFRFRVIFESGSEQVSAVLRALSVQIAVPDRIVEGADLTCPAAGIYVPFAPSFLEKPAIAVDGQGLPVGVRSVRTQADAAGFHQQFVDDQGNGIACTFDYIAKGYGRLA